MKVELKHQGGLVAVGTEGRWREYRHRTRAYIKPSNVAIHHEVQLWSDGASELRISRPVTALGHRPLGAWRVGD